MSGTVKRDGRDRWQFTVDVAAKGGKRRQIRRRGFSTKKAASQAMASRLS